MQASDFFADESTLNKLCGVLGRRFFSTPFVQKGCSDATPSVSPAQASDLDEPAAKQPRRQGQCYVASSSPMTSIVTPGQVRSKHLNEVLDASFTSMVACCLL